MGWELVLEDDEEAGRVNVNVWTVEAGCRVDAIISTSRVNESYGSKIRFLLHFYF